MKNTTFVILTAITLTASASLAAASPPGDCKSTDLGNVMPAGYPAMLAPTCAPTRTLGAWWNFTSITITLVPECSTPAKPSTWGSLKAIYR